MDQGLYRAYRLPQRFGDLPVRIAVAIAQHHRCALGRRQLAQESIEIFSARVLRAQNPIRFLRGVDGYSLATRRILAQMLTKLIEGYLHQPAANVSITPETRPFSPSLFKGILGKVVSAVSVASAEPA